MSLNAHLAPNFAFLNMLPAKAKGARVWDENGGDYLDFSSGIAVTSLGHCHPVLIDALHAQAQKLWHISNVYTTSNAQTLAKKLVEATFDAKVFFANSGAEANEAAFKLARKVAKDRAKVEGKHEIIACSNSFHGRTLFTVAVGGQEKYSRDFAPLPAGISHVPFNDVEVLKKAVNSKTCAIVLELIQGEGGVIVADKNFVQVASELAKSVDALLIFDEVQTGMGRTGKLFAYQNFGVEPDILTLAKGLGGGFPISAMVAKSLIAKHLSAGSHGTTFGGNPLATAVASAAFDVINSQETLSNVARQSEKLQVALHNLTQETGVFREVRGAGLLLGAELLTNEKTSADFVNIALENGLMLLAAGSSVVRFAPALTITDEEMAEGLTRLAACTRAFSRLTSA